MSASGAVVTESVVGHRSVGWAVLAVTAGLTAPWWVDRVVGYSLWTVLPNWYTQLWALTATALALSGLAWALLMAKRGPETSDRVVNWALVVMSVALTWLFVEMAAPAHGMEVMGESGPIQVPPDLDRGILNMIGVFSFGLPIIGVFLWRALRRPTGAERPTWYARRVVGLGVILLVTAVAFYLAWADHTLAAMWAGFYP